MTSLSIPGQPHSSGRTEGLCLQDLILIFKPAFTEFTMNPDIPGSFLYNWTSICIFKPSNKVDNEKDSDIFSFTLFSVPFFHRNTVPKTIFIIMMKNECI